MTALLSLASSILDSAAGSGANNADQFVGPGDSSGDDDGALTEPVLGTNAPQIRSSRPDWSLSVASRGLACLAAASNMALIGRPVKPSKAFSPAQTGTPGHTATGMWAYDYTRRPLRKTAQ